MTPAVDEAAPGARAIILVGLGRDDVAAPTGPRGVGDIRCEGSFLGTVAGAME